jgi:hypothetical protein
MVNIAHLLVHSDAVPLRARDALRAALSTPVEFRTSELESAARLLQSETDLSWCEVRDLVGLTPACGCA